MNVGGTTSLGTLVVYLTANATQYQRAMNAVQVDTATAMEQAVKTVKYASVAIAGSLALIGAAGVREFGKFDEAMVHSLAILGKVSDDTRKRMEDTARAIGRESTNSADKVAGAYQGLASAGLNAEQSMAALTTVERFAVAGQLEMSKSVLLLTDSVGALGLASLNAAEYQTNITRVADVLAMGANISQASVEELATALQGKVAGGLRLVNKSVEEGVAVLGAFAKAGIKGTDASDKMGQVLRDLQISALEQPQAWQAFGVSVYDASGNMRNFADITEGLEIALAGMSSEQKRMTLTMLGFQDRSVSAMQALLGFSGTIREYQKALEGASGTTDEMAKTQLTAFNAQMTILLNNVKDVLITIGEQLAPVIMTLNGYFHDGANESGNFAASVRDLSDIITTGLVVAIQVVADVIAGWRLVIKGGAVLMAANATVVTNLVAATAEGIQWIIARSVDGLNVLVRFYNQTAGKLSKSIQMGEVQFKGFDFVKGLRFAADVTDDAVSKLAEDFMKLTDKGKPSVKMMERLNVEVQKSQGWKGTLSPIKDVNFQLPKLDMNLSKVLGTVHKMTPEFLEFQKATRDPLGQSMIDSFKNFDKVLAQGLINLDQYNAAVRDVVAKQNQFVMPVKGLQNTTGLDSPDQMIGMENEQKLLEDSYARKLKATQDYYDSLGTLTAAQEQAKLDMLQEMETNYTAMTAEFQYKRMDLILSTGADTFAQMAATMKDGFGEQSAAYKAAFAISKAFAVAQSIVNMHLAISSAMTAQPFFPVGLMMSLKAAAEGASIISNIQQATLSFEGGGSTGSGPRTGGLDGKGGFMAMLHPKEEVTDLTKAGANAMEEVGGAVTVQITQNFYGGVTQADLAQWSQKTKQEAMIGTMEGIKRGGSIRRGIRR